MPTVFFQGGEATSLTSEFFVRDLARFLHTQEITIVADRTTVVANWVSSEIGQEYLASSLATDFSFAAVDAFVFLAGSPSLTTILEINGKNGDGKPVIIFGTSLDQISIMIRPNHHPAASRGVCRGALALRK